LYCRLVQKNKKKAPEVIKMKKVKCEQKDEEIVGVSSQDEECEDISSDIQVSSLTMKLQNIFLLT
jgi:hypothetical protein